MHLLSITYLTQIQAYLTREKQLFGTNTALFDVKKSTHLLAINSSYLLQIQAYLG